MREILAGSTQMRILTIHREYLIYFCKLKTINKSDYNFIFFSHFNTENTVRSEH